MSAASRNRARQAFLEDPFIAAALAAHGRTATDGARTDDQGDAYVEIAATGDLPRVRVAWDFAMLRWMREGRLAVHYEPCVDADSQVVLADALPEQVIAALAGRALAEAVTLPGDPGWVVRSAHRRTLGDQTSTVLAVGPATTTEDVR